MRQTNRMELAGRKVVVVGLGHFGGQIAATRWLLEQGAHVTVTDLAPPEKLTDALTQLQNLPITFHLGEHREDDLDGCDLLVVSPAVPKDRSEFIQAARRRGIPITSEMNLFCQHCSASRIVGITGSAGKSTTTALIGAIFEQAARSGVIHRAWMGGNIGHSLLADLPAIQPADVVTLELSSFQLEDLGLMSWSPNMAVITNIRPNHLDRHGTIEAYTAAKMNIVRFQRDGDAVLLSRQEEAVAGEVIRCGAGSRLRRFEFDMAFANELNLPGRHNRENAAAAIAASRALGVPDEIIHAAVKEFKGLPHRLELVERRNGVRYYNDSKSTTPESACLAVDSFEQPVVILVGGRDKGMSFAGMAAHLHAKAKAVICYGEAREKIWTELQKTTGPARLEKTLGMDDAVALAGSIATTDDVVVLSPACTSYDAFSNYEERGERFRQLVRQPISNG